MLYKDSAIAVVVAIMLVAASLFAGVLTTMPAFAHHDPDAIIIASEEISQDSDGSMIVDAVDLKAMSSNSRVDGTLTVEIVQDEDVLTSATLSATELKQMLSPVEVELTNVNVTGSFEVEVEYVGRGVITVSDIDVIEGTEVAELPDDEAEEEPSDVDEPNSEEDPTNQPDDDPSEIENVIAVKTITQGSEDEMTVDTVEFSAQKSFSRASGTITVAIVQDDGIIKAEEFSTAIVKVSPTPLEASFDELELTDDFQVVFMYDGRGIITISDINVPGETALAEDDDSDDSENPPPADGEVRLIVEAVDQGGNKLTGLWVALLNGQNELTTKGFTGIDATFILDPDKSYIVEMGDYFDEETGTAYDFNGWQDSASDNTRRSANPTEFADNEETFTAEYIVTVGGSPPPAPPSPSDPPGEEPPTSPPPNSPTGTVTAFAFRIPSEFWGPTFTSANAEMYFVVYNSTGWIVYSGFFDENGHVITGLNEGETYWISPTDCDECHGDPHDVVFDHWEDGSTERQRPVTTGMSVGAYYAYDPDP